MNEGSATSAENGKSRVRGMSLVLIGFIVALGIFVIGLNLLGGRKSSEAKAPAEPSAAASQGQKVPTEAKSACGLPGYATSGSVRQAPQAQWSIVGAVAAPSVARSGPGKTDTDGFRHCFAHTPEGALLAAANYAALSTDQSLNKKMAAQAIAAGAGREAAAKAAATADTSSSTRAQIAAFRSGSYNGEAATVDLVLNTSEGQKFAVVYYLSWEDGDWKLKVNDAGELLSKPQPIDSMSGYLTWAGV